MFKDAVADELICVSPCVLSKGVLPMKVDKDPDNGVRPPSTRATLHPRW
jgi:hypothetical protein